MYPHQGFMVVLGTACLLIGAACLIAAVVILPSDPAGTGGATGIGSFFCLAGWYVLAARRCPQMTVSERGVRLHRDSPLRRALKLNRVTELAWADIRRVEAERRVQVSSRTLIWVITIYFWLADGRRKRVTLCYTGISTWRLLTQMKRFAEIDRHRIEWPEDGSLSGDATL